MKQVCNAYKLQGILAFSFGLLVMAFGVELSVKADLGVSPISCVPYVLSLSSKLTLGELTVLLNILLILLQIGILRKQYQLMQLLKLPAVVLFGFCIDLSMHILADLHIVTHPLQLLFCLLSCLVIAIGVVIVVRANLTCLPGEGLVLAITSTFHKGFGKTKMAVDSAMVAIGVVISFVVLGHLQGIREGTLIAALLGYCVKFFLSKLPAQKQRTN